MPREKNLHACPDHAIGQSSNPPWPKRKKLIIPASTAATTMIFFPSLSIWKGFGLYGCFCDCFSGSLGDDRQDRATESRENIREHRELGIF